MKRVLGNIKRLSNKEILEKCKGYITAEMEALNDRTMDKEVMMLETQLSNISAMMQKAPEPARPQMSHNLRFAVPMI